MEHIQPPVLGIVGWKNSGKTTLITRLVEELTRRGWRIATVKHAHHGFTLDAPESDSARHRKAGARETAIIGDKGWAIVRDYHGEDPPELEEVVSWLAPADLVLVEGFKHAPVPKIEVRRSAQDTREPLAAEDPLIVAIAADHAVDEPDETVFRLDDIAAITDFVEQKFGPPNPNLNARASGTRPYE